MASFGSGLAAMPNTTDVSSLNVTEYVPMNRIKSKLGKILKATPDFTNDEKIILRDFLALQRTKLANERTFLSYNKFSLYLITAGIALIRIENLRPFRLLGFVALGASGLVFVVGLIRFLMLRKQLNKFY
jgi:putative membrane protein